MKSSLVVTRKASLYITTGNVKAIEQSGGNTAKPSCWLCLNVETMGNLFLSSKFLCSFFFAIILVLLFVIIIYKQPQGINNHS